MKISIGDLKKIILNEVKLLNETFQFSSLGVGQILRSEISDYLDELDLTIKETPRLSHDSASNTWNWRGRFDGGSIAIGVKSVPKSVESQPQKISPEKREEKPTRVKKSSKGFGKIADFFHVKRDPFYFKENKEKESRKDSYEILKLIKKSTTQFNKFVKNVCSELGVTIESQQTQTISNGLLSVILLNTGDKLLISITSL